MSMSALCFLADERIWDREKYPDFVDPNTTHFGMDMLLHTETFYNEWVQGIGGETNAKIREFLKGKRLA